MEHVSDINGGLMAIAFWGFIGICVIGGIWDAIRKRETKHETLRRLVESGQTLDENLLRHLDILSSDSSERFDRGFIITALWLLPIGLGMAVFASFMGQISAEAEIALYGVAAMLGVMGCGCLLAGKVISPWYSHQERTRDMTARPNR